MRLGPRPCCLSEAARPPSPGTLGDSSQSLERQRPNDVQSGKSHPLYLGLLFDLIKKFM